MTEPQSGSGSPVDLRSVGQPWTHEVIFTQFHDTGHVSGDRCYTSRSWAPQGGVGWGEGTRELPHNPACVHACVAVCVTGNTQHLILSQVNVSASSYGNSNFRKEIKNKLKKKIQQVGHTYQPTLWGWVLVVLIVQLVLAS